MKNSSDPYSDKILKNNLERLQKFSNIMISAASLTGTYLTVPPAFCELLGYTEQELLTMTIKDITHPDDYEIDWNECQRLLNNEIAAFDLEKRYLSKDGRIIWVYIDCSLFKDDKGKPLHFLTLIKDITKQKREEKSLSLKISQHQQLLDFFPSGIFLVQNSKYHYANKAGLRVLEAPQHFDISGADIFRNFTYDNQETELESIESRIRDNHIVKFDKLSVRTFQGNQIMIEAAVTTVFLEDVKYAIFVVNNISERIEHETELKLNYDLIQNYIKYMEKLTKEIQKMRHKYLNILQGISGYLDLDNLEGAKQFLKNSMQELNEITITNIFRLHLIKPIPFRSIIASEVNQAELQGIDISLLIADEIYVEDIGLSLKALCEIVEQYLEQAIEKARESNAKRINIIISEDSQKLKLIIQNTTNNIKDEWNYPDKRLLQNYPNAALNVNFLKNILIQELVISKE